ncbi:hypothetical protein BDV93DRAFT_516682, partial [Ceratobasidium sp. AG-I]
MSAREERAASRSRRGREHGHSDDEDDNTARASTSAPGAPQRDPNQEPTNFEIYSLLMDIQRELSGIRDIQDSHTTDLSSLIRVVDSIAAVPRIQSAPPGGLAGPSGPSPTGLFQIPPKDPKGKKKEKVKEEETDSKDDSSKAKFKLPEAYEGKDKGKGAKQWLLRMMLVFAQRKYARLSEQEKMLMLLSNTKGAAADWAQPLMEQVLGMRLS